jgi:hypothetical protein
MSPALRAPLAVVLVVGAAIAWDKLREPFRDPRTPCAVVDMRTFRAAQRRVERLVAMEEWTTAYAGATAICIWLRSERHYGSRRRQQRLAAELERWTARKTEYNPAAAL